LFLANAGFFATPFFTTETPMPKALFFNVPGHGHVNPSLPLVAELVRRKHTIMYFITEGYRRSVEATGASVRTYSSIRDDYFTSQGLSGSVPQKTAYALITTTEQILPELLEAARAEKPDYILYDGMCPWGAMVARILKLPAIASLALPPLVSPPPRALPTMLPVILPMVLRDFRKGLEANKQANVLTKKYGVAPFGFTGILNNTGDVSISYTSSEFQAYSDTVADSVRFVGWTPNEVVSAQANTMFSPESSTHPLIYVSLGTMNNDDVAFFKTCIEAFAAGSYSVIMSTGNRVSPETFGTLPPNITVHKWVPQIEVLKHASLFVSHGGMNSVHDALYLGVPLLVVPQQTEQTLTAMRVVELGAGLMLKKTEVTVSTIRTSAARLLLDPQFKASANLIGDSLRAAGGVARAADEIEALLGKQL
jgi:MGT family glycosyltransferase